MLRMNAREIAGWKQLEKLSTKSTIESKTSTSPLLRLKKVCMVSEEVSTRAYQVISTCCLTDRYNRVARIREEKEITFIPQSKARTRS